MCATFLSHLGRNFEGFGLADRCLAEVSQPPSLGDFGLDGLCLGVLPVIIERLVFRTLFESFLELKKTAFRGKILFARPPISLVSERHHRARFR